MMQSLFFLCLSFFLLACGEQKSNGNDTVNTPNAQVSYNKSSKTMIEDNEPTHPYFGDTHLHTSLSGDAYASNTKTPLPKDAYHYAKGMPVISSLSRARIQRVTPLDFLAVTDHAEYMGLLQLLDSNSKVVLETKTGKELIKMWADKPQQVYYQLGIDVSNNVPKKDLFTEAIRRPVWESIIQAAEEANEPGKFTSFIGWEWTSQPGGSNLHRVVLSKDSGSTMKKFLPYNAFDSEKPEDLWNFLETTSKKYNAHLLAIPHNSNISNGLMFDEKDSYGNPLTAEYAKMRMKWEPVAEITQLKGTSETHPNLSPNDEFANFEIYEHVMNFDAANAGKKVNSKSNVADYMRQGLGRGLEFENKLGSNPYKFGFIGSTDSHSGYSNTEEFGILGKFGTDTIPENKKEEIIPGATGWDMGSGGMAVVWAEKNDREHLFNAIKRKETYATTGTFIRLRVFGGYDYKKEDVASRDMATIGYSKGVPMGGDLTAASQGQKLKLMIRATKDPIGANLDRVQVIKGWLDKDGKSQEKIFNVAWSPGRGTNPDQIKPVGNTVNIKTAKYSNSIGIPELTTVWEDPTFDPSQRAFYYVRVIEIPTPRHSLFDAISLGIDPEKTNHPAIIQERAYSSPIWYTPTV